jgi:hypothetical protein
VRNVSVRLELVLLALLFEESVLNLVLRAIGIAGIVGVTSPPSQHDRMVTALPFLQSEKQRVC